MEPRRRLALVCSLLALLAAVPGPEAARAADVPSPEAQLGYRPGADFHLVGWADVVGYFQKVDTASDRVAVRTLGTTTEGRPYIVAAVSAPETIRDLARYQDLQHRLTDPRIPLGGETSESLVDRSKPVVVITCSIHSSETASTFMAIELLHELATRDDPITREILDTTILLLVPSANPDGVDIVARWYDRTKGQPWEGSGLPRLYHKYAGHDTNRDWFMLNLEETRLLSRLLYKEWFPTFLYDVHQMGSRGARLFVPPFFDPVNPNLDPRINQGILQVGAHMAGDLAAHGKQGVLTNAMYDNWWNGGNRTTPQRHNIVAVLTEAASVRMATPIFLEKSDLSGGSRGFSNHAQAVNFVDPWPGGWWRLRDVVDYELICARSLLMLAGRYRRQFQSNLRAMGREAVDRGEQSPPYAWVVPRDQRDPGTAAEMLRRLHATGIEVRRARSTFQAEGTTYPEGTWILSAAQPYRTHLKDMMERQVYPARFNARGEAESPYDVAGWTLPLQMGVRTVAVAQPLSVESERLDRIELTAGRISGDEASAWFGLRGQANDDFTVVNALLAGGVSVDRSAEGGFRFDAHEKARAILDRVLPRVSSQVIGHKDPNSGERAQHTLHPARLGLYQPWVPSMDEGWTRYVLEQFHFPYATLHNAEVRAGNLADRYDVILFPSIPARVLREGYAANQTEPAYVGGLGAEGVAALRAFVEGGGTLVCLEDSCEYAINELGLPVTSVLKSLKSSQFYCPGSIVRLDRQGWTTWPDDPLPPTVGMPQEVSAYFDHSLAFDAKREVLEKNEVRIALRYARTQPLESGWLLGSEHLAGKAALAVVARGGGRVILFGFPPQHRGQPHGTFRLLFNTLYAEGHGGTVVP